MTNPLSDARTDLAALMRTTGITVTDHEPDRPAPPQIVIRPSTDTWITENETFSSTLDLHISVLLVTRPADSNAATLALEDMLHSAIIELQDDGRYVIEQISRPMTLIVSQQMAFPAVEITLTTQVTI